MSSEHVRDELTIGPPGSQYTMSPAEGPADSSEELTYQYGLEVEARSQWAIVRTGEDTMPNDMSDRAASLHNSSAVLADGRGIVGSGSKSAKVPS